MTDIPPTRRTDEPPARDGAPLAGWPVTITVEEAARLQTALKQLQTALDAAVRERDEARAEVERLRAAIQGAITYANGRETEWGARAEECFRILESALEKREDGR